MSDENYLASRWGLPVAVVLFGVAFRLLLSSGMWVLRIVLLHLVGGILFGGLAALYAMEKPELAGFPGYLLVAIVAILAVDIGTAIVKLGLKLRDDPAMLLDLLRGPKKP